MTGTITINDATDIWTNEYPSINSFDIGIITNETMNVDNGVEVLSLTGQSSEDSMTFNMKGQKRTINVNGTFTGTTSEIIEFTKKMKICSDNQVESIMEGIIFEYIVIPLVFFPSPVAKHSVLLKTTAVGCMPFGTVNFWFIFRLKIHLHNSFNLYARFVNIKCEIA